MRPIEYVKRYTLFIISLFFSALGVAFTKYAEIGVSPISSVANVLSLKLDFFTIGSWLIVWNCVLILGQIIILRKKFQPIQLLQIPLSFLFGWFTDICLMLVKLIPVNFEVFYPWRIVFVVIGVIILGFGIALSVIANVIMNSGEAFVKAVSDGIHKDFGNVKIVFDVSCVVIAVVLSFIFFHELKGTREGTVITALCTGFAVKLFTKLLKTPVEKILTK